MALCTSRSCAYTYTDVTSVLGDSEMERASLLGVQRWWRELEDRTEPSSPLRLRLFPISYAGILNLASPLKLRKLKGVLHHMQCWRPLWMFFLFDRMLPYRKIALALFWLYVLLPMEVTVLKLPRNKNLCFTSFNQIKWFFTTLFTFCFRIFVLRK